MLEYLYLATEFCPASLRQWIRKRNQDNTVVDNRLTLIKWFSEVCEGIQYLHGYNERGILHQDIKPSNILLTRNGKIKIIDFGSSTIYSQKNPSTGGGTQLYKPSEQQDAICSKTVDIYPLGK